MKKINWLDREAMPPLPYFTLCVTQKEFDAVLIHLKKPEPRPFVRDGAGATTHTYHRDGQFTCVVCINAVGKHSYEQVAAMLAHEAVHVYQIYVEDILREDKPSSELQAYVVQRIVQALLHAYTKQRR